jgi:hypothetical protein
MKSTFLFFVFVVVGTTFVATECPLPDLPKFYSTTLQVNIAKSEKANPFPKNVGHTVSMVEVVDETMARAVLEIKYGRFNYKHSNLSFITSCVTLFFTTYIFFKKYEGKLFVPELNAGEETLLFEEKVIWDVVLGGVKAYLAVFSINQGNSRLNASLVN